MSGAAPVARLFRSPSLLATAVRCLAILVLAELIVGIYAPSFYNLNIRNAGSSGGYIYVPNIDAAYRNQESGRLLRLHTNSQGFRDRERALAKVPGVKDIVVLGNSFVAAHQVSEGERFTGLLEERLVSVGQPARVFNFGVHAQAIINHMDLALYAERGFSPDAVVLVLTVAADFTDTSATTFRNGKRITYSVDGDKVVRHEAAIGRLEGLGREIRSLGYSLWLGRIAYQTYRQILVWATIASGMSGHRPICPPALANDVGADRMRRLTRAIVEDLHAVLGARLIVAILPTEAEVRGLALGPGCESEQLERWANDLARNDVRVVSLLNPLRSSVVPVFYEGGHLNGAGHRIVAERLLAEFH